LAGLPEFVPPIVGPDPELPYLRCHSSPKAELRSLGGGSLILVQQIEGNIIMPPAQRRTVDSPVLTLSAWSRLRDCLAR